MPVTRKCKVCGKRFKLRQPNNTLCSEPCKAANRRAYNREFARRDPKQTERFRRWYAANKQKHIENVTARKAGVDPETQRRIEILQEFAEAQSKGASGHLNRYGYGLLSVVRRNSAGGAIGRWFITPHAVHRYIQRVRPMATYEQALNDLVRLSETAHLVRRDGDTEHWRAKGKRLRFRVAPSSGELSVLMTVLTEHDGAASC